MGLNIKNAEAEAEIRGLASDMGVGLTQALIAAVKEVRARRAAEKAGDADRRLRKAYAILAEFDAIPDIDPRPWREIEDEMYDEGGAPA